MIVRNLGTKLILAFVFFGYKESVQNDVRYGYSVRNFHVTLRKDVRLQELYNAWIKCTSNWWISFGQPCEVFADYFKEDQLRKKYTQDGIDYIFFGSPKELKNVLESTCGWSIEDVGNNCLDTEHGHGECGFSDYDSGKENTLANVKQNLTKNCDTEINALQTFHKRSLNNTAGSHASTCTTVLVAVFVKLMQR